MTRCSLIFRSIRITAGAVFTAAVCQPVIGQEGADSWVLNEVIVSGKRQSIAAPDTATATRTSTPLEKVPQSVQVLTRTLIEEQDLQTLSDALVNVSGVTPSSTMQTVLVAPYVRGFPANYYFDGLPTFQLPASASDPATLVGTERIEVAKGPTAALYGGASGAPLGGLINIVSREPDRELVSEILLRGGSDSTWGGQGRISVPLGDAAAFSLSAMYEEADSFIHEIGSERYAFFPTLSWSITDQTRLTFRGQFNRLEQLEYAGLPVELISEVDRFAFAGATDAPHTKVENAMGTIQLDHSLGVDAGATLVVRRYENAFDEYSTFPLVPALDTVYFFGSAYVPSEVEQTFISASAWKSFGRLGVQHKLLAGIDYDDTDYFGAMGLDFAWGMIDYVARATSAPYGAVLALSDLQNNDMRTTAVFVQDQLTIGKLDITAGLRWSQLDMKSSYTSFGIALEDRDQDYSEVTPRIGLTYQVAEGVALFTGYSEGFHAVLTGIGMDDPQPETSEQIEAGVKLAAPVRGFTGTLAAYELKRRDVITSDPFNPGQSIQSGEQRARGVEADLVYEPSAALSTLFSYVYTDAEVTRDNTLPVGDRLRAVPEHRGRLAARYRFQGGVLAPLELGAGITYTSDRELTLPNTTSVDALTLADMQASWDFGVASLGLSLVNVTAEVGFEPYQYFGGQYVIPTQPRSLFVTLRAGF